MGKVVKRTRSKVHDMSPEPSLPTQCTQNISRVVNSFDQDVRERLKQMYGETTQGSSWTTQDREPDYLPYKLKVGKCAPHISRMLLSEDGRSRVEPRAQQIFAYMARNPNTPNKIILQARLDDDQKVNIWRKHWPKIRDEAGEGNVEPYFANSEDFDEVLALAVYFFYEHGQQHKDMGFKSFNHDPLFFHMLKQACEPYFDRGMQTRMSAKRRKTTTIGAFFASRGDPEDPIPQMTPTQSGSESSHHRPGKIDKVLGSVKGIKLIPETKTASTGRRNPITRLDEDQSSSDGQIYDGAFHNGATQNGVHQPDPSQDDPIKDRPTQNGSQPAPSNTPYNSQASPPQCNNIGRQEIDDASSEEILEYFQANFDIYARHETALSKLSADLRSNDSSLQTARHSHQTISEEIKDTQGTVLAMGKYLNKHSSKGPFSFATGYHDLKDQLAGLKAQLAMEDANIDEGERTSNELRKKIEDKRGELERELGGGAWKYFKHFEHFVTIMRRNGHKL